jgi:hypothetical protein
MNKFTFDPRSQRYRYISGDRRGQFVSTANITRLVEDYMIQQRADVWVITDILLADKMSVNTWQYGIASALKSLHINAYSLGKGGIGRLTEDDMGLISDRLKSEFKYLNKFAREIATGDLSEAQIKNRVAMYVDAAHSQWQQGSQSAAIDNGDKFEKWNNTKDEAGCADCKAKGKMGWQPIGSLGVPGVSVRCLSRCRCNLQYSASRGDSLLEERFGWVA